MLTLCVVFKTSAARILKFIILNLSKSDRFLLLFTSVIMTYDCSNCPISDQKRKTWQKLPVKIYRNSRTKYLKEVMESKKRRKVILGKVWSITNNICILEEVGY